MGEAKRKEESAARMVTFDFAAPRVIIGRRFAEFIETMKEGDDSREVTAVKHTITTVVQAAFPPQSGAKPEDRKKFAAWQEDLDVPGTTASMPWGRIEWLRGLLTKTDLGLPVALSQWSEAVLSYIDSLATEAMPIP